MVSLAQGFQVRYEREGKDLIFETSLFELGVYHHRFIALMQRVIPASLQNLKKVCGGVFLGGGGRSDCSADLRGLTLA